MTQPIEDKDLPLELQSASLAARWKVSVHRISQLKAAGMPLTSLAEAEAWRAKRSNRRTRTSDDDQVKVDDADVAGAENVTLKDSLRNHRRLVAIAQRKWEKAQASGSADEQRLAKIYNDSKNWEMRIERMVFEQDIASKLYVKTEDVFQDFARVLSEIRADLIGLGIEIAPKANPDNPGLALKVIDDRIDKLLRKIARLDEATREELVKVVDTAIPEMPAIEEGDADGH